MATDQERGDSTPPWHATEAHPAAAPGDVFFAAKGDAPTTLPAPADAARDAYLPKAMLDLHPPADDADSGSSAADRAVASAIARRQAAGHQAPPAPSIPVPM